MKKIVLIINLLWWINLFTQAQCDKTLVRKATELAGKDVVLVRDFRVKLKEGNKRNPVPSSRYSVLMQKDITYRFTVADAIENTGKAILNLYDKSNLLATTFDLQTNLPTNTFQYKSPETENYQVVITFSEGHAGCATGVMSMVVDSAFMALQNQSQIQEEDILYVDMENYLQITTDSAGKLEVSIDNGKIVNKNNHYIAIPEHDGIAKITVKTIDSTNKVVEETVKDFRATRLPEPKIFFEGFKDNYLNTQLLHINHKLEVSPSAYRIQEFYISATMVPYSGLHSYNEYLTNEQLDFIKNLPTQTKFYLNNIRLEKPDGTIVVLDYLEFYVR